MGLLSFREGVCGLLLVDTTAQAARLVDVPELRLLSRKVRASEPTCPWAVGRRPMLVRESVTGGQRQSLGLPVQYALSGLAR